MKKVKKISKWKKFRRVFKRKLLKPLLYAIGTSFALYLLISNIIIKKSVDELRAPQFVISRISNQFDNTEFMHMLLTIQELRTLPEEGKELIEFINKPFPAVCPPLLEYRLKQMNWTPTAFQSRVKKLFAMYEIYDRTVRLDETISFLAAELEAERLPKETDMQIKILQEERQNIINQDLPENEYDFMKEYGQIVIRLQPQNH